MVKKVFYDYDNLCSLTKFILFFILNSKKGTQYIVLCAKKPYFPIKNMSICAVFSVNR